MAPVISGKLSLTEFAKKTEIKPSLVYNRFHLDFEKYGRFYYLDESKLSEARQLQTRRPLIRRRASHAQGMLPVSEAAKRIGCSLSYSGLLRQVEFQDGRRYVPLHKIDDIKATYEKKPLHNELQNHELYPLVTEIVKKALSQNYGVQNLNTVNINDLERRLKSIESLLSKGNGQNDAEALIEKLRNSIANWFGTLEKNKKDLELKIEYELKKAKEEMHKEFVTMMGKTTEMVLSGTDGDYYRAGRLTELVQQYKFLREPLTMLERISVSNVYFNRGLRWIMGSKPGSSQTDAVEGIYSMINFINDNNDTLGERDVKSDFIKAIADCEKKDKKKICKILGECKSLIYALRSRNAVRGIYLNVMSIVDDLNSVNKEKYASKD